MRNSSDSATTTSPNVSVGNEEATQTVGRVRRRHAWMKDYKLTGIEDPITHLALFSNCYTTSFESAMKEEKNGEKQWMMKLMPLSKMILG